MVKRGLSIAVWDFGKGFANLGDVIRRVRCLIPFARVVEVVRAGGFVKMMDRE